MAFICSQAVNGLRKQLTSHDYLMCCGILYLVLETNFHKGCLVKMKHSAVAVNISTVLHSFIWGAELKEGNEGIYGLFFKFFTPLRKS